MARLPISRLTKKQKMEEIIKCGQDPVYFVSNYLKVSHPKKGFVPFKLYPFQEDCLKAFQEHRFVITNKSRQLGLSTTSAAYALWLALFQREKNILIIATKLAVAKNFIKKVKANMRSMPDWLILPNKTGDSLQHLEFDNGSRITAVPTSPDAGRSEALSLLIVDEAAHVENIDELWLGLRPTLSCLAGNTKVFTSQGIFNIEEFHKNRNVGEYFKLKNWDVFGKNGLEKLSHGYVSPESDTLIFTTKHGYSVETTLKHPLWKLNKKGGSMEKAAKLKIGDYLRIQHSMNCYGKNNIDEDIAYMLGGYIAEGNCHFNKTINSKKNLTGIQITNTDNNFREVYLSKVHKFFNKNFKIKKSDHRKLNLYSKEKCLSFFKIYGINPEHKCYEKTTPKLIWTSNKKSQCEYLSGLFDGDGSVTTRGVILNSTSKTLIEETQLLLLNMGFHSNINYIDPKKVLERERKTERFLPQGKPVKNLRDSWQIQIPRSEFVKFENEIGFRIIYKKDKLKKLGKKYIQDQRKLNTIPVSVVKEPLIQLIEKTKKPDLWFRKNGLRIDKFKSNSKNEKFVNTSWLSNLFTLIEKTDYKLTKEEKEFFGNVIGDFFWDPIVKIEKSKNKTYDFTVPKTHTFIQNGILGSNTGGSAILISSPSGVGTLFHKIWVGANEDQNSKGEGRNEFYPIELPWTVHPEHDEKWFEKEKAGIIEAKGERGVAMELLCSFNSSGDTYVPSNTMEMLLKNIKEPMEKIPVSSKGRDEAWIFKNPMPGHKYVIGADVARGDGADYSAFNIIDVETDEVVADYKGKCLPDKFAEILIKFGMQYNNALICQELNSFGVVTGLELKKSGYENLYYEKFQKNMYMSYMTQDVGDEIPGFTTGQKSRLEMLSKLNNNIRNKKIKLCSKRLYEELQTFVWKNDKPQAQRGYNDDLVISLAIAANLYESTGRTVYDTNEVAMSMLAGMSRNEHTMDATTGKTSLTTHTADGFWALPGVDKEKFVKKQHEKTIESNKQKSLTPKNTVDYKDPQWEQFRWLFDD